VQVDDRCTEAAAMSSWPVHKKKHAAAGALWNCHTFSERAATVDDPSAAATNRESHAVAQSDAIAQSDAGADARASGDAASNNDADSPCAAAPGKHGRLRQSGGRV
jgi:hypothetical protein